MNLAPISVTSRPRSPYFSLASTTIERPSGVSSAKLAKLRRIRQHLRGRAIDRDKIGRHAIAQGDRAGLIQQQSINIASGFHGAAAHRKNVLAQQAVDAGDADGGKQAANGRRYETDQQGNNNCYGHSGDAGIQGHRHQGHASKKKNQGKPCEQDIERDLVGSLLPLGSFHQSNHAIQERLSWARRDAYHDAIGQYFCSTGYGRTVTAGSRE